jgi:polysaccharide export outer membrane protein
MAGDLTVTANRDDILIVRDDNGNKVFGHVNLNTREVYSSPYYYLHNNDLVYVKPNKIIAQQNDRTFQYLGTGVSVLSLLLLIFRR